MNKHSEETKRKLGSTLKLKLQKKLINNITIRELVEACGLNRQTFYYHFDDIYDLATYTIERDLEKFVENRKNISFEVNLIDFFNYLTENKQALLHIITPTGQSFIRFNLTKYENAIVNDFLGETNELRVFNAKERKFVHQYIMSTFEAIIESWISDKIDLTPEELVQTLEKVHFVMGDNKNR